MYSNPLKRKQSTASEESRPDPDLGPTRPLALARERAKIISTVARDKAGHDEIQEEDEDVQWLKSKAEMRSGYNQFCNNRHRKLKNSERVRFWAFAAEFSKDYYGFTSGAPVC